MKPRNPGVIVGVGLMFLLWGWTMAQAVDDSPSTGQPLVFLSPHTGIRLELPASWKSDRFQVQITKPSGRDQVWIQFDYVPIDPNTAPRASGHGRMLLHILTVGAGEWQYYQENSFAARPPETGGPGSAPIPDEQWLKFYSKMKLDLSLLTKNEFMRGARVLGRTLNHVYAAAVRETNPYTMGEDSKEFTRMMLSWDDLKKNFSCSSKDPTLLMLAGVYEGELAVNSDPPRRIKLALVPEGKAIWMVEGDRPETSRKEEGSWGCNTTGTHGLYLKVLDNSQVVLCLMDSSGKPEILVWKSIQNAQTLMPYRWDEKQYGKKGPWLHRTTSLAF